MTDRFYEVDAGPAGRCTTHSAQIGQSKFIRRGLRQEEIAERRMQGTCNMLRLPEGRLSFAILPSLELLRLYARNKRRFAKV